MAILYRWLHRGSHMVDRSVNEGQEKVVDTIVRHRPPCSGESRCRLPRRPRTKDFICTVFKEHADIDAVIHFAAHSPVAESMADPLKYFDSNTAGMVKTLEVT